jgi:hypothetical protein
MKILTTYILLPFFLLLFFQVTEAQDVIVQINADAGRLPVSPYIYGRNNHFSNSFGTFSPSTMTLDVSRLPKGLYYVQVSSSEIIYTENFILQP